MNCVEHSYHNTVRVKQRARVAVAQHHATRLISALAPMHNTHRVPHTCITVTGPCRPSLVASDNRLVVVAQFTWSVYEVRRIATTFHYNTGNFLVHRCERPL